MIWLKQLLQGPDGLPDEGALGYVMAQLVGFGGAIYMTATSHVFPFVDLASYEVALIPLYTAATAAREWAAKK